MNIRGEDEAIVYLHKCTDTHTDPLTQFFCEFNPQRSQLRRLAEKGGVFRSNSSVEMSLCGGVQSSPGRTWSPSAACSRVAVHHGLYMMFLNDLPSSTRTDLEGYSVMNFTHFQSSHLGFGLSATVNRHRVMAIFATVFSM
jgi:hypothetical protein